jgi:hypothetical protein
VSTSKWKKIDEAGFILQPATIPDIGLCSTGGHPVEKRHRTRPGAKTGEIANTESRKQSFDWSLWHCASATTGEVKVWNQSLAQSFD